MIPFRYEEHPRHYLNFRYIYPVLSRRRGGISLGINLNPDKLCNFRCIYCQVDRLVRGDSHSIDPSLVMEELKRILELIRQRDFSHLEGFEEIAKGEELPLKDISFSGDGEPTLAKEFSEIVYQVLALMKEMKLDIPLIIFTNGTRVHHPQVKEALQAVMNAGGEIWFKLDAGTQEGLRKVNGSNFPYSRLLENLRSLSAPSGLVVQTMLCRDAEGPIAIEEVEALIRQLKLLADDKVNVQKIQLYTVARKTPDPHVQALTKEDFQERVELFQKGQPFPLQIIWPK